MESSGIFDTNKLVMGVIYILICISIFVAAVFLFLFIKSVKSGQFDDDYTPSVRMLFEDELKSKTDSKIISNTDKNKNNSN
mgnify:CR=1 FL=1